MLLWRAFLWDLSLGVESWSSGPFLIINTVKFLSKVGMPIFTPTSSDESYFYPTSFLTLGVDEFEIAPHFIFQG